MRVTSEPYSENINMEKQDDLKIMAGPCSVESESQIMKIAEYVKQDGAQYLRGGAWKPRTKGGDWEGHKTEALKWLQKAGKEFDLKIVTEILGPANIDMTYRQAIDLFREHDVALYQVGARNAQNQELLNALGEARVPVLLKNGMNTTLKEWLGSASRLDQTTAMLCVRGKTNETDVARNGQDIATIAELVRMNKYPVIFDPSHISGKRELVYDVTIGAIAMGVDGLIVETHYDPVMSFTDSRQTIAPKQLELLVKSAREQRRLYLDQQEIRNSFLTAEIPRHLEIFFRRENSQDLEGIIDVSKAKDYYVPASGIRTVKLPVGELGKLRQKGWAIGRIVEYVGRDGSDSVAGVHITMPQGEKIQMSPYNEAALNFRKMPTVSFKEDLPSKRIELAHGYANRVVQDVYLTIDMGKLPELKSVPLLIYRPIEEK